MKYSLGDVVRRDVDCSGGPARLAHCMEETHLMFDKAKLLEDLTEPQREAVTHVDGPLLVLAAAGSGKTRVITRRIGYLISQGIRPYEILAITFTNKAAGEMRERIAKLAAEPGEEDPKPPRGLTVCTFHSLCARLLRQYAGQIGLSANFTIYDQSDTKRCIKRLLEEDQRSGGHFQPGAIASAIGKAKNKLQGPEEFAQSAGDFFKKAVARIYEGYQSALDASDALDFDDLLMRMTIALRDQPEVREAIQNRFRYLMIDEYQDTNYAQYLLAKLIGEVSKNFCATGDPDQSIYGWRGADVNNILQFEKDFPDARVVRLEQNYRSTKIILRAADALIQKNKKRKHKRLWTENEEGKPIDVIQCRDQEHEAGVLAERIAKRIESGVNPSEIAIFYRVNALSRAPEESLRRKRVPYQIIRGVAFYQRKEIKDMLAYAICQTNPNDRQALERIINVPPRGIGKTSLNRISTYAEENNLSLREAIGHGDKLPVDTRARKSVAAFAAKLDGWAETLADATAAESLRTLAVESGYNDLLAKTDDAEGSARENVDELVNAAKQFDEESPGAGLLTFLEQAALVNDQDAFDEDAGRVSLMTLHAAKGLEFPYVHIVGLEEGLLPHERMGSTQMRDIEEERRLFFVGITRAKKHVTLTLARERSLHGSKRYTVPSPFINEMPQDTLNKSDQSQQAEPSGQRIGSIYRPSASKPAEVFVAPRMSEVYDGIEIGRRVYHPTYSMGRVVNLVGVKDGENDNRRATVQFEGVGEKVIYLRVRKLKLM